MPKVALVLLNWNGIDLLKRFLPDIVAKSESFSEIWLADNGSDDNSVQWVKTNFPGIKHFNNYKNLGFAKGYNIALKHIKADYYILLNNDIEVTENWISPLIELMESDPNIACSQPKILSLEKKEYFEHAGAAGGLIDIYGYPFCRGRILNEREKDSGQYNDIAEIFWASGACFCIRADLFNMSGGFDENFFAHMEEIDLCWRLKNRGYRIMYCGNSVVYHLGGGTLPYLNPKKTFLNFRNNLLMIYKNLYGTVFLQTIIFRLVFDGIACLRFLLKGQFMHFTGVIKAHFSFYHKLNKYSTIRKKLKNACQKPNQIGIYNNSIMFSYFIKGIRTYKQLDYNKFL